MLAAPKSGSGKTTITCALLQALKDCGEQVISYKCGPDYIDPMFHRTVIGVPSKNLDTFFAGEEATKELFLQDRTENDFAQAVALSNAKVLERTFSVSSLEASP